MITAYVVGAVRTPVGRRDGALSGWHPADLGGFVVRELLERCDAPGAAVDDVVLGCVSQIGAQSTNIARVVALSAGLPESVPGTTVDRQCGSSQQAVHFAAHAIGAGAMDLVVAGGVEVMSLVPIASAATVGNDNGLGLPRGGRMWSERYGNQEISQFRGAELIAQRWGLARGALEQWALRSHRLAVDAIDTNAFQDEIVSVNGVRVDEGPRRDTSEAALASLSPIGSAGLLTAGVASQVSDGAAALMLASEKAVSRYRLTPLATIHATAVVGSDPVMMLTGPIPATEAVLERAGLGVNDVDVFEVNEAFAPVVLAWLAETGADRARVNPLGGAIALGHPLGATGARLMTTMIHHLHRTGGRYGLQTMCEGGGMANATVVERA